MLLFVLLLDSGCDSMTDAEVEDGGDLPESCNTATGPQPGTLVTESESLIAVQPNRILCGVMYVLVLSSCHEMAE